MYQRRKVNVKYPAFSYPFIASPCTKLVLPNYNREKCYPYLLHHHAKQTKISLMPLPQYPQPLMAVPQPLRQSFMQSPPPQPSLSVPDLHRNEQHTSVSSYQQHTLLQHSPATAIPQGEHFYYSLRQGFPECALSHHINVSDNRKDSPAFQSLLLMNLAKGGTEVHMTPSVGNGCPTTLASGHDNFINPLDENTCQWSEQLTSDFSYLKDTMKNTSGLCRLPPCGRSLNSVGENSPELAGELVNANCKEGKAPPDSKDSVTIGHAWNGKIEIWLSGSDESEDETV